MLRRFSIAARLFGLVGLVVLFSLVALVFLAAIASRLEDVVVEHTKQIMLNGEKSKIKAAAHSMSLALAEALKFASDDEEKKSLIRAMVGPVRFEDDASGYYFVYKGTTNVALPPQGQLEGKDLDANVDRDGVHYVRELSRQAHAGGGFVSYIFPKPSGPEERKLSYAEMIPGTDFWVGTGVYIDNVNREETRISGMIASQFTSAFLAGMGVFAVLVALLSFLCLAIARSVANPMGEATGAAERIASGDLNIRLDASGDDEAARLQASLNRMTATLRQNITEIQARRQEAESKALQAEQALAEARRAGREAAAQVALRIESLRKISTAVAHQLRNPTTIIGGMAGLLLKKPALRESYLEYLDGIIEAARRIERIASAVNEYSTIHLEGRALFPAALVLEDALEAGQAAAEEMGKKVVWELDAGDAQVNADRNLLAMAVREAVMNAVEALPDTGGRVRLWAEAENGRTLLAVCDDGPGIAPQELEYLLDPFYTTKSVGVGMGLTKANRAVQEHGGTLSIESAPGTGTTVRMLIPGQGQSAGDKKA